ncbi:MAG: triose-phosphate isomerase [Bacteroidales bacterium]|nr:triose-phosphate isomerase [Bacteroidales bacterium]
MRKKIAAGNWKMNTTLDEGILLISDLVKGLEQNPPKQKVDAMDIVLAPPFLTLAAAVDHVKFNPQVHIAAQNCSHKEKGAYTGEISVDMIKSVGAEYVIIGHSERREYFKEDAAMLATKVDLALSRELVPIFCCGEPLEVRQSEGHFKLIKEQISESLFHLDEEAIKKIVIAYEPVWAIGTGVTATPEQAQEMHAFIRGLLAKHYGDAVAQQIPILYGGSVNAKNAVELFANKDVDGGLVGGASLKADDFLAIIRSF